MNHESGDVLRPRDCVLLRSGTRKGDLPYVAKIAALWENPDDGRYPRSREMQKFSFRFNELTSWHSAFRRNDVLVAVVLQT